MNRVLKILGWRQVGIIWSNPVLENTYVFFFIWLAGGARFTDVLPHLGLFLLLNFAMASYGFLLNDAVDCARDLRHGTANLFADFSTRSTAAIVLTALGMNLPLVAYFENTRPGVSVTWAAWLVCATLYSLPGVYLKGRGLIGLIAVALALRTLPLLLVLEIFGDTRSVAWIVILAYVTIRGLGSDLAHQITDFEEDRQDGIRTFAQQLGLRRSHATLDWLLQVERLALVACVAWLLLTVPAAMRANPGIALTYPAFIILTLLLAGYAFAKTMSGVRNLNPHQPDYGQKDVFYLLHKTFPKIVFSLYLLILLLPQDRQFAWLLLPLAVYFRLFSPKRLFSALNLRPREGGPSAT